MSILGIALGIAAGAAIGLLAATVVWLMREKDIAPTSRNSSRFSKGLGDDHEASEYDAARRVAHEANITRYRKLLAGKLTPSEREFIEQRVAEETDSLRKLAEGLASGTTSNGQRSRLA